MSTKFAVGAAPAAAAFRAAAEAVTSDPRKKNLPRLRYGKYLIPGNLIILSFPLIKLDYFVVS